MVAIGEIDCVPLVDFVPVQPLEAVHEVALVDDQVSVADCPLVIELAEVLKVRVGAGVTGGVTTGGGVPPPPPPPPPPPLRTVVEELEEVEEVGLLR